jgi:hypothetical protein
MPAIYKINPSTFLLATPLPALNSDIESKFKIFIGLKKAYQMSCSMLSSIKSIIIIALAAMLTIANTEAHPSPKESLQCAAKGCDWM